MEKSIIEKNKFALVCLQNVKENISKNRKLAYNPVYLSGLSKEERYRIFFMFFNKEFNHLYKSIYISCKEIKVDESFDFNKDLIIIEDIELLANNGLLQEKIYSIINNCLKNNIQVILCSNVNVDELIVEERLKCKMKEGILLYLEK